MDVVVCRKTLAQLENDVNQFKLNIIHQIGKNYLSVRDYKDLVEWYSEDLLTDMMRIVQHTILVKIHKKYMSKNLSLKEFIRTCLEEKEFKDFI
jgi:hypothetical protein